MPTTAISWCSEVWFNADGTVADTQTYTYDEDGNMLTASNSAGTYTYTYDGNQLATADRPERPDLSYGYDEDGNVTSVSDSQGGVTSYVYDGESGGQQDLPGRDDATAGRFHLRSGWQRADRDALQRPGRDAVAGHARSTAMMAIS